MYALEPIPKNKRIVQYDGEKITTRESQRREALHEVRGHVWCFAINRRLVRDATVVGNIARYINHSCVPNCYTQVVGDTIWIRAARTIAAGEELSYDYCTGGTAKLPCNCRRECGRVL